MNTLVRSLDVVRRELWRWSARTELGRRCVVDKGTRLALLACGHIAIAFLLSGLVPLWVLLVGPLVLGVPHIVGDVRYLLLRPRRRFSDAVLLGIGLPLLVMTALRVAALFGAPLSLTAELWLGAAAIVGGVLFSQAPRWAKTLLVCVVTTLCGLAAETPRLSVTVFAHLHNGVAVGLWLWLARKSQSRRQLIGLGAFFLGAAAAITLGAFDGVVAGAYLSGPVGGLSTSALTETLAPGVDGYLAVRLVTLFAFAQAVHYSVWLRLVPQEVDPRSAPPSFARSWQRMSADLGRGGMWVVIGLVALVATAGVIAPASTRHGYLMVVVFHGWLELAVILALCARATRPKG